MDSPTYTKEDMKLLASYSEENSITKVLLKDYDYDPGLFKKILKVNGLKSDLHYLYEVPLSEVPLFITKGHLSGILKFRLKVGK